MRQQVLPEDPSESRESKGTRGRWEITAAFVLCPGLLRLTGLLRPLDGSVRELAKGNAAQRPLAECFWRKAGALFCPARWGCRSSAPKEQHERRLGWMMARSRAWLDGRSPFCSAAPAVSLPFRPALLPLAPCPAPGGLHPSCPVPAVLPSAPQVRGGVNQPCHSPSATLHPVLEAARARGVLRLKCLFQAIKQL